MSIKDREKYNEYMRVKILERYHARRDKAKELLGGKCIVCGTTENLEMDHIDPKEKVFPLAKMWSVAESRFFEEVEKCQLLCKDHHMLKTKLNGEHKGGHNKVLNYSHGTGYMYYNDKCRCEQCRKWRKDYRAKLVGYNGNSLPLS